MATAEKPLQKKKKKKQNKIEDVQEDTSAFINLEFPSTTTKCNEILSHDCFVSAEFKINEELGCSPKAFITTQNLNVADNQYEAEINTENKESEVIENATCLKAQDIVQKELQNINLGQSGVKCKDEGAAVEFADEVHSSQNKITTERAISNIVEPSAPDISTNIIKPVEFLPIVIYPNLNDVRKSESETKCNFITTSYKTSKIKSFTDSQLKEVYFCKEIEFVKQFEIEFLTNALQDNFSTDPFYNMLLQYSVVRSKLRINQTDAKNLQEHFSKAENQIWSIQDETVEFSGVCADNLTVRGSEIYKIAVLKQGQLKSAYLCLSQLHELVCFSYTNNLFSTEILKLKINQIIREILSYPVFAEIAEKAPIKLKENVSSDNMIYIRHLRRAISILFAFARKHTPDKGFLDDVRSWLSKLIALYLRVATKEDHWFLLFHILRCPGGVASWAISFFQVPKPIDLQSADVFMCPEINHCVSVLYILLLPVKKRNEFLTNFLQKHKDISDPVKEELWIVVDSDGEEGSTSVGECAGLKESDLVALLNQVPFEALFKSILNIHPGYYNIQQDLISGNHLIKLIAFNYTLIELLGEGLVTYNTERYKQFAKRLGRLIRHCVQYISDIYQLYMQNNLSKDLHLSERINIEFNSYVLKACSYIYKARNLGTWQYFSSLPFSSMDLDALWQLFYYLNVGFPADFPPVQEDFQYCLLAPDFSVKFETTISDVSPEDLYYMLQAFFEMAVERDRTRDWELIKAVCSHIFQIGYIYKYTRDICYKTSRDMLVSITTSHPDLISVLLHQIKDNFKEVENSIYLLKSLPFEIWEPSMDCFEILSYWLLNFCYETRENLISRTIISRLEWSFNSDNKLFLPRDIHIRMACLICEAYSKHSPEMVGISGISESVRQISTTLESHTTREQFLMWCWNMLSILRIHLMDQNREIIQKTLQNPADGLRIIPDLKEINIVFEGVSENRPLAIYLSILASLYGHSIPLICQKGFPLLRLLLSDYRHGIVIRCIQLIIPLFIECPENLIKCESFQEVMKSLITSDRTYIKMAKDLISSNSSGPVLELLVNMIQCSIISYLDYGLQSPAPLISLWLQVFTNIPNWQNMNSVYIIDIVLKIAYQFPDAWFECKEYFRVFYKNNEDWKLSKTSTFKIFLGTSNMRSLPPISSENAWLSLILLELEHELQELQYRFWPEFLRQLSINEKCSLDNILKKTASLVGRSTFPASALVLYKYANIISSLDVQHPLFVIFNQNFFSLYLARVYFSEDEQRMQNVYGVADKFYEHNISLMKKVKARLKRAEDYYLSEANKYAEDSALSYFYTNYSKLMKSFLLWLEETSINKISKDQNINLPPQFNTLKLTELFIGNAQHWTEFLDHRAIRKEQTDCSLKWQKLWFRASRLKLSPLKSVAKTNMDLKTSPLERIKSHLQSYDKEVKPPDLIREHAILKPLIPKEINSNCLALLTSDLNILDGQSRQFYVTVKELNSLSGMFNDFNQSLYKNIKYNEQRLIKCSSIFSKSLLNCAKPAEVTIQLRKPQINQIVQRKLGTIKTRHDQLINQFLEQKVDSCVSAMQRIEHTVKYLKMFQIDSKDNKFDLQSVRDIAIQFFFHIIKVMNENMTAFPPTNELCLNLLSELGIFIRENQETQGIRILDIALKRPELLRTLSDLFVPSRCSPECFLNMYKFLIESHLRRCDKKVIFVLMSKFDLPNWLQNTRPKLNEINRLLKLIITGLENWNQPETSLLQDLFRRHLVHVFEHEFPEHYGEVLQAALNGSSEQNLMPEVLMDLLNSLLIRAGCQHLSLDANHTTTSEQLSKFATQQTLFNFKEITDTVMLFARHFQTERLQHGLHGLYPKHKKYCIPLSIWFCCLSQAAVVAAIYAYPGVLADQICDWLFAPINEMYSPWLVTYTAQNVQQSTANWIRQLIANGRILLPWSDLYIETAQIMLNSYIGSLHFILESLPVSNSIMGHVFSWYVYHFATQEVGQHIRSPIHASLAQLPWERFNPIIIHIELFHKILNEYLPECHSFLGHIFLRTNWNAWIRETLSTWSSSSQAHVMSQLLSIFVQISLEPNVHDDRNTPRILKESLNYPWHLIEYQGIEHTLNWFVLSADPAIILKIPSESNETDKIILELLKISCGMQISTKNTNSSALIQSKRLLYTQSFIRLLRTCAAKHNILLGTKEGLKTYNEAIIEQLDIIEQITISINSKRESCEMQALNLISQFTISLASQAESTSKLFVEAMVMWQSKCNIGNPVICTSLDAIGLCTTFVPSMHSLLEATIYNYFRCSDETNNMYAASWDLVLRKLGNSVEKLQLGMLLQAPHLLSLHCYILYKIRNTTDHGEKITFLQDISQLLESVKTNEAIESRMAIIWGAIISCGSRILESSENINAKKPLLMLARYLQVISTKCEGWGEGLLGVIGLKKDSVSNRRKILTRCLACIIFSLFPDKSSEEAVPNQEFSLCLEDLKAAANSKKYADVKLVANQAILIVEDNCIPKTEEVIIKIYNITRLLYNDSFLITLPNVWDPDKCS